MNAKTFVDAMLSKHGTDHALFILGTIQSLFQDALDNLKEQDREDIERLMQSLCQVKR